MANILKVAEEMNFKHRILHSAKLSRVYKHVWDTEGLSESTLVGNISVRKKKNENNIGYTQVT